MRVPKKSSGVLREGAEVTRKVRDHSPPGAQLPGRADVPAGPEYLRSGYHEPAGRVSATTTRRRRLTLFIRTEFSASDGTLRVPAHHRGPAAAGAWWWTATRCAPARA